MTPNDQGRIYSQEIIDFMEALYGDGTNEPKGLLYGKKTPEQKLAMTAGQFFLNACRERKAAKR